MIVEFFRNMGTKIVLVFKVMVVLMNGEYYSHITLYRKKQLCGKYLN